MKYIRVDIKVTFRCNNHCDFCAQGNKRDTITERSVAQVEQDLAEAKRKHGANAVTFTGGEPTLHPHIVELVSIARKLGYIYIQIQTNGRMFAYPGMLKALYAAGANELSPSLHGACPATHDGLTHSPGSFMQTVQGMKNAASMGMRMVTNSVITSGNYKELPELAALLVKLGVKQYQFAFVHIVGTAKVNKDWIVPRKSDIMPYVKKGLDVGRRSGVFACTEAIPFCFMKGYEDCVSEQFMPEASVVDGAILIDSYGDYRRNEGKVKHEKCKRCLYYKRCEGPWKEYPEIYGWDEFVPVTE